MVYLTFTEKFNAVHRLWNPELDERENAREFGECANPRGHGHTYRVEITVAAPVTAQDPVVIERRRLSDLVRSVLVPKLRNGDLDTAFGIPGFVSTGENVTQAIWDLVLNELPDGVSLAAVKVAETPKNSFVCLGSGKHHAAVPMA